MDGEFTIRAALRADVMNDRVGRFQPLNCANYDAGERPNLANLVRHFALVTASGLTLTADYRRDPLEVEFLSSSPLLAPLLPVDGNYVSEIQI